MNPDAIKSFFVGDKRNTAMPQVPTFVESGIRGVDSGTYWVALAPAGTPRDTIATLHGAMAKVLQLPDVRQRLMGLGFEPIAGTPEEAAAHVREAIAKWAKVVAQAKIRSD